MEVRMCANGSVMPRNMNTCAWLPNDCTMNPIDPLPPVIASKVILKTGNGDTVFADDLYKNISKSYYLPEQVTKNIAIPSTTSMLNMTLSSMKAQCAVNPNYKTDTGMSFSNNTKIVNRVDLPNFYMGIPAYAVASQI